MEWEFESPLRHQSCFKNSQNTPVLTFILTCKKRPDSSVGRATDWKSVCRWFNSTSGHRLIISDISILSYIILVWFEELNKFYKVLQTEYWAINPQPSSTLVLQNASTTTPTGYPPTLLFWERYYPQKNYPGNQLLQECGDFTWRSCLTGGAIWVSIYT